MKTCEEVLELLPDHPPLSPEAMEVQEHLRLCPDCAEAGEALALTLAALQADPSPELLRDGFAERVLGALPPPASSAWPLWRPVLRLAAAGLLFAAGALSTLALRPAPDGAEVAHTPTPPAPAPSRVVAPSPVTTQEREATPATIPAEDWDALTAYEDGSSLPVGRYVEEAGLVLRAVDALREPDPHWLRAVAAHIDDADLVRQGERLLLTRTSADPRLRRLISGTQLVLIKLRNAGRESEAGQALQALRREVRETGLLDAYQTLLEPAEPAAPQARTVSISDPL